MKKSWGLFLFLCLLNSLAFAQSPIGDTIVSQSLRSMLNDQGEIVQLIWEDGTGPTTTHPGGGGGGDFADGGENGTADRTLGNTDNFELGLLTNNLNRLNILGNGRVGIGIASPLAPFHVQDTSASELVVFEITSGSGLFISLRNGDNDWAFGENSTDDFIIRDQTAGNIDVVRINNGAPLDSIKITTVGLIGLGGDASPDASLEVVSNGTTETFMLSSVSGADGDFFCVNDSGLVGIGTNTPSAILTITPDNSQTKITFRGDATNHIGFGSGAFQLNYHVSGTTTSHVHAFYGGGTNGNGTELMRIRGDGLVGIGTAAPDAELHLDGGVNTGIKIDGSGGGCLMIRDTDDAGWTECFTLNGVMSCTTDADGICDGA